MSAHSEFRRLHGTDRPPPHLVPLRAGPLTAVLDGVDLRYVRHGETELVRRIYAAVRDRNWDTIEGHISDVEVDKREGAFTVRFSVRHASHDTGFSWTGTIDGSADGEISFRMDGHGDREMLYNRIGFCVLHPWREAAGAAFRGRTDGDGVVSGELPRLIGQQGFADGVYVPLYPSVRRLEIALPDGGSVRFAFEGDLFETEDQRNWTDASLKTYCTPLSRGFPHRLAEGERRSQAITVSVAGRPAEPEGDPEVPGLTVGAPTAVTMPSVGLALPSEDPVPSAAETAQLALLSPAHVRDELHLSDPHWPARLATAATAARDFGAPLELALFVARVPAVGELTRVAEALDPVDLARVLVCVEGAQTTTADETTPGTTVQTVRDALGRPGVPVAGGTDMYFCELNRTRPAIERMDGIFWSMNPQVHAFDDLSLMETPEAQGEQVRAARAFSGSRPVFVGPVTLRRRYNVNATVAEEEAADDLPDSVDPRQASLMGAAWTLASVTHLAQQGADVVTYFETVGWRGVVQGDGEPARPDDFPAAAGEVFPLFHVLADAAELRGASLRACETARPLEVSGLAVARPEGGTTMLVANLGAGTREVTLTGVTGRWPVRRLNASTAGSAMADPEAFRASAAVEQIDRLALAAYETIRIDIP